MPIRNLCVLCGGRSAEHEVSLQSARNVIAAVDRSEYRVLPLGITKQGKWFLYEVDGFLLCADDPARIRLAPTGVEVSLTCAGGRGGLRASDGRPDIPIDVAFPVLHGTYGEDGAIQGMLKMAHIPCAGTDLASSAVCMDKDLSKRLLQQAGLPVAPWEAIEWSETGRIDPEALVRNLGLPLFVKPARLGSSVGISKIEVIGRLRPAIDAAFEFDTKVVVEAFVPGREIECAILGNENPQASLPGEVVPHDGFYSYAAKYLDDDGALLAAPANLDAETVARVRTMAVDAFSTLGCTGMARVDFFLGTEGGLVVNELNTIPGFTKISMYPRLWEVSGVSYSGLVARLLALAVERFSREAALATDYAAELSG